MEIAGRIDPTNPQENDIESQILGATKARVTYLREHADTFTFESVRRMLEEDLKLKKYALDLHKSFVKQQLIQCLEDSENDGTTENLQESEERDNVTPVKEDTMGDDDDEKMEDSPVMGLLTEETNDENSKQVLQSEIKKAIRKRSSYIKANSENITMGLLRRLLEKDLKLDKYSLDSYKKFINEELDEVLQAPDETKAQKKTLTEKVKNTADGKRKRGIEKLASSSEKPVKETATATPGWYGKRVEHLKSVIKSCGMSVPPSVYRKAKQAPEEKREDTLIQELKEILAKQGLSSNPSEKEIKEVKRRKEITKELEGIDTSNILSSSRRRSSTSFVPPPNPKTTEESKSDDQEET